MALRRLNISTTAPTARHLNSSLLYCVWRIPFQHHTMRAQAAHTFMPTRFQRPRMGCILAALVMLFQHVTTCLACAPGAQRRPVLSPFICSVLPWRPIHPGQLEPWSARTHHPPFAPVSPRLLLCGSLSHSLPPILSCSLSCAPLSLSPLRFFPTASLSLSLTLSHSLSLSLSHKRGVRDVRCISIPPGVRTILYRIEEVWRIH